jgi:hypothetical protein
MESKICTICFGRGEEVAMLGGGMKRNDGGGETVFSRIF